MGIWKLVLYWRCLREKGKDLKALLPAPLSGLLKLFPGDFSNPLPEDKQGDLCMVDRWSNGRLLASGYCQCVKCPLPLPYAAKG